MNLDLYAGPGGWSEGARMLGLPGEIGIEWDEAACLTRAAAGHRTVRADVSAYPAEVFAGKVEGLIASPPCLVFSGAGSRAGIAVLEILAGGIHDAFSGRHTRAQQRREMAHALKVAGWPKTPKVKPGGKPPRKLTRAQRSAKIRAAVISASQVIEPACYIAACDPEWVALEQVPEVLPLWRVYAAELEACGYSVWCGKLNSADYGVPQTRIRAILIASRVRTVRRPAPTHYDPRKGDQLWGTPWVSMAQALGWGATGRPVPTVTAGGTALGGYEPFAKGGREAFAREQEAGRWILGGPYRTSPGDRTHPRRMDMPATTIAFGHPAHVAVPEGDGGGPVLHRSRGASVDRRDHPVTGPAPAITSAGGKAGANLTWKFRNNNNNNACVRSPDEPAGTLFFGHRSNWAAWVTERPATSVMGDPRLGRPGHKERENGGESHFAVGSVRISVEEAAILQSFPANYPWRGSKTAQYTQVGNAIPPLLAAHILSVATGIPLPAAVRGDAA